MSDGTAISWAEATWSPITGCTKTSEGCNFCYIDRTPPFRMAHRKFNGDHIGATTGVQLHSERLGIPMRWRKARRVFVCSLADLFQDEVPDRFVAEVFAVMSLAPQHSFQVLTKRHARLRSLLNSPAFWAAVGAARVVRGFKALPDGTNLLPNAWIGVSTENQKWADIRIPALLDTPAAVRWISAEPLLGPVDISRWIGCVDGCCTVPRGGGIRSGAVRGAADRPSGQGLAVGSPSGRTRHNGDQDHSVRAATSGELDRQVSAGPVDVQRDAISRDGTPSGVAALRGADSGRADGEPQEWDLVGQSTVESGTGDTVGAGHSLHEGSAARATEPVWNAERHGAPLFGAGCGDQGSPGGWGAATGAGARVRGSIPAHLGHRQGQASIAWVVCGGESGPKARPMHPQWARSLRDQCVSAGVAYHFKQFGEWGPTSETIAAADRLTMAMHPAGMVALTADNPFDPFAVGHPHWEALRRAGKKATGRLLDGREWNEYPEARTGVVLDEAAS